MEFIKQYLTFEEYRKLGGTLEQMPFNILEFKAQKEIDKYTFNRLINLEEYSNEVKVCVFDLMNIVSNYTKIINNTGISSESTDGYSVNYGAVSKDNVKSYNADIKNCIKRYLVNCKLEDNTPYMYCGVE